MEHFEPEAAEGEPEVVEELSGVEHFEADAVDESEAEVEEADATMVMHAPAFDIDSDQEDTASFGSLPEEAVEHFEPEAVEGEPEVVEELSGVEVEHFEVPSEVAEVAEGVEETAPETEPEIEEEPDATMVMQAPAFDVVTSEGAEETAAYEAPTEMELEIEEEGEPDSGIAGYDENPDGDMFLGEIDMEPEMPEMPDIEEEKPSIGTDEPTSGGGLEPGAMDMGQEEIVEEYEVGEIELAGSEESEEPEEYKAQTGLEMAAERVAEEVFVEKPGEDADMTMVMEAPVFEDAPPEEVAAEEVDDEAGFKEETLAVQAIEDAPTEEVAAVVADDVNYEKETVAIEPPSVEAFEEAEEADVSMVMETEAVEAVEAAEASTKVMEPPPALMESDTESIMEADRSIEAGDYMKAMDIYNVMLDKAPDNGTILQREQELKLLIKVHGQEGVLVEHRLDKFLIAIQRRRDEFYANP